MTEMGFGGRCPLCDEALSDKLHRHIPDCPERERTLEELEERAGSVGRTPGGRRD